jgi:PIN domain nuclease of toxin-antitoxin system
LILILDAHALLWWFRGSSRLTTRARDEIENFAHAVFVSSVSVFELATKFRIGKLPEAQEYIEEIGSRIQRCGFSAMTVTIEHARVAGLLPGPHRDPFDRLLIAQAKVEKATVVSADPVFRRYGVPTLW